MHPSKKHMKNMEKYVKENNCDITFIFFNYSILIIFKKFIIISCHNATSCHVATTSYYLAT